MAHDVFAPLENLVRLDLSGTDLTYLPLGMFDGLTGLRTLLIADSGNPDHGDGGAHPILHRDVFQDLGNLRELDLRPDEDDPLDASPLAFRPLTSLETYNGRPYAKPGMPENLRSTVAPTPDWPGAHTVTLTWDAPAGESNITGYRVLRNTEGRRPYKCTQHTPNYKSCDYDYDQYAHVRTQDLLDAATTTWDEEVVWGDWHHYYVEAITAEGESLPADLRVDIP